MEILNDNMDKPKKFRMYDFRYFVYLIVTLEVLCGFLSVYVMDGGTIASLTFLGILVHWTTIGYLSDKRQNSLSLGDLVLIFAGFPIYVVAVILLFGAMSFVM